jgi:hypothetical protein
VEQIEYKTIARADDAARMVEQLNDLGKHGWEVCGRAATRTASEIPWVTPRHEVLLLKRRKEG